MEQSDNSRPNTATEQELWDTMRKEFDLPEMTEEQLRARLAASYFQQPNMTRFLLEDALAIKLLLLDKNLITVEEFEEHKKKAKEILCDQINSFIDDRLKKNPAEAKLYNVFLGKESINNISFDELKNMKDH